MREYIIADNQDISKAGMMFLLSKQKDVATLLEADNKAELIQQLRLYPQAVVVLDYTLFDFAGADELIVLQERFKEVDWILFSDELSINFLRQVLFSSMAFGVVMKDNSKEEIMTAIQCAGRKQRYICNHVSNLLLSGAASPVAGTITEDHLLTQTEKNILKEIALGKTTKEIAAEKNLSFHTINSHRKNIFRKLGVNNAHQICHEGRHRRLGGILYIKIIYFTASIPARSSSSDFPTPHANLRSLIINNSELSGGNALQLFRRQDTELPLSFLHKFPFRKFGSMANLESDVYLLSC